MRNHLDRYGFRRLCPDPDTLEGFMSWLVSLKRYPHTLLFNQTDWHRYTAVDTFLHLERLGADFATLPFVTHSAVLPRLNVTSKSSVGGDDPLHDQALRNQASNYLTPAAADLVFAWAKEDFAQFDYSPKVEDLIDK